MPKQLTKDPDALLDFGFDWSSWLEDGETITTSNWSISQIQGDSATLAEASSPSASNDGEVVKTWLEGGEAGELYRVTNSIVTDESREDDRSFLLSISQR